MRYASLGSSSPSLLATAATRDCACVFSALVRYASLGSSSPSLLATAVTRDCACVDNPLLYTIFLKNFYNNCIRNTSLRPLPVGSRFSVIHTYDGDKAIFSSICLYLKRERCILTVTTEDFEAYTLILISVRMI